MSPTISWAYLTNNFLLLILIKILHSVEKERNSERLRDLFNLHKYLISEPEIKPKVGRFWSPSFFHIVRPLCAWVISCPRTICIWSWTHSKGEEIDSKVKLPDPGEDGSKAALDFRGWGRSLMKCICPNLCQYNQHLWNKHICQALCKGLEVMK